MIQERLQKLIAKSGYASRRKAEVLIEQGRVKLNSKVAVLGDKATLQDVIQIDNQVISIEQTKPNIIMLNKPEGYITTRKDPKKRKTVFDLLPKIDKGRWISIGRLDINSSGLLLFTNDGDIANTLMHPSAQIEREYLCRIYGEVNHSKINKLKSGIKLSPENKIGKFISVTATSQSNKNQWFSVVLTQGRYREVRRLWQSVDCQVSRLSRIRFANIRLPKDLPVGQYCELTHSQINSLIKRD